MSLDLDSLNTEQKDAVTNFEGPTLILAGAGTGKTRVITSRIAYMLSHGIDCSQIAAMTFTNKAAREMRERVAELVGSGRAKKLSISTFHSFCLNILRKHAEKAGIEKKFTLIGTSDQLDLVNKALEEKVWSSLYRADSLLFQISSCKNWLLTPEDIQNGLLPKSQVEDPAVLAAVYKHYERQLQLNRAIDFDDCIFKVVMLLRNHPEVKKELSDQFRYILIDEFQDTNSSQFAIVEELASAHNNICVVGDDDQSIYSWRGAMYETMERFQEVFPATTVIKLEQNYRCTPVILNAANTVIQNNSKRMDKTLWSAKEEDTPIVLAPLPDAVEEARWVGSKCIELLGQGHKPSEIAILYRSNAQAKLMEMALRECSVSYKTFGGQSFFERKEIKNFLGYLRLIASPHDHLALWRVINMPHRGIGLKTQEHIEEASRTKDLEPYQVIKDLETFECPPKTRGSIKSFVETIEKIKSMEIKTPDDLESLGNAIIKEFKLEDEIKRTITNVVARHHKLENLRSLSKWLKKSGEDMLQEIGSLNPNELLDRLTLAEAPAEKREDSEVTYVSLMTIHASKGLEYPIVFVVGCEEGLLPHKNSIEEAHGVPEERRLFYVALTRAKEKLHLSYAAMRQTGFQKEVRTPSRFIGELPEEMNQMSSIKEHQKKYEDLQKERRTSTKSKLAQLRESLKSGN